MAEPVIVGIVGSIAFHDTGTYIQDPGYDGAGLAPYDEPSFSITWDDLETLIGMTGAQVERPLSDKFSFDIWRDYSDMFRGYDVEEIYATVYPGAVEVAVQYRRSGSDRVRHEKYYYQGSFSIQWWNLGPEDEDNGS